MARLVFSVAGAAKAAQVERSVIVDAVKDGTLAARQLGGQPKILACDMKAWLKALPDYKS